eukprot:827113_1
MEKIHPKSTPPRWVLNAELWEQYLKENRDPTKRKFIQSLKNGFDMTQKRNEDIHVDQGKLEYKQSVEHWREQCKQMDAHLGNKCIWGPFTKQEMEREKILKDYKIMPHFVNERLKDDGSTKYRLVTDAKSKQKNGMNFNDNIYDHEKYVEYIKIINIVKKIVKLNTK